MLSLLVCVHYRPMATNEKGHTTNETTKQQHTTVYIIGGAPLKSSLQEFIIDNVQKLDRCTACSFASTVWGHLSIAPFPSPSLALSLSLSMSLFYLFVNDGARERQRYLARPS